MSFAHPPHTQKESEDIFAAAIKAADEKRAKAHTDAIRMIGNTRDHMPKVEDVIAEAKANGIKPHFDGDHGEIIEVGDKTGKIGADDRVEWI